MNLREDNQMQRIRVGNRTVLKTTPVYDSYWRFAAERQRVFMKRVKGLPAPWTADPIIANHKFTNAYRASDRVSQYLIKNVIYKGCQSVEEVFFRILLFKIFNKIETWELLKGKLGELSWSTFNADRYSKVLDIAKEEKPIYSAAYIMPSPLFGKESKHRNHLYLLQHLMKENTPRAVTNARTLKEVYEILFRVPSFGSFLAFQFTIDLNYSEIIDFSEMDLVVAGPGAKNGIMKCFKTGHGLTPEEIIVVMADRAPYEFDRLRLNFHSLWGRPLQLIDYQNLFCETDKYARVAHPNYSGDTKRSRIKQKFTKCLGSVPQWYPPKWNLKVPKKYQTCQAGEYDIQNS